MEDVLHVDETSPLEIHVDTRPQKLLDQDGKIEAVGIEPPEVAAADELRERFGDLGERRAIAYVVVRNAVDGRRFGRNRHAGVEPPGSGDLLAVGHHLNHRNLDDAVTRGVHAGGFEVEEDDRAFEVQLHFGVRYALIIIGMSSMSVALVCLSS